MPDIIESLLVTSTKARIARLDIAIEELQKLRQEASEALFALEKKEA